MIVPSSGIIFGGGVTNVFVTGNVVVAVGIAFVGVSPFVGMEGVSRPAMGPDSFVSAGR